MRLRDLGDSWFILSFLNGVCMLPTLQGDTRESPINSSQMSKKVALGLVIVALGCIQEPAEIVGPRIGSTPMSRTVITNGKDSYASCNLAVRVSAQKYRTKSVLIRTPADIVPLPDDTVRFVFLAWQPGQADPSRLATCDVPSTQRSVAFVRTLFGKGATPEMSRAREWADAHDKTPGWAGKVEYLDVAEAACAPQDPIDFGCSCSAEMCPGWATANVGSSGPSIYGESSPRADVLLDDDTLGVSFTLYPDLFDPEIPRPVIICWYNTDRLHLSTTPTYLGTINVHGWSKCDAPVNKSVKVELQIEKCISFFCWWSTVTDEPTGYAYNNYPKTDTSHGANCVTGYWRGSTTHKFFFPVNYTPLYFEDVTRSYLWAAYCPGAF